MSTIADLDTPAQEDSPIVALFGDTMTQLSIVCDELTVPPYNTPPEKLQKAYEAVLELRVAATETPGTYAVQSRQRAEGTYLTHDGSCTCPYGAHHPKERYGCYHPVAAKLYQRWQQNQRPLTTPLPKETPRMVIDIARPAEAPTMTQEPRTTPRLPETLSFRPRSITAIVADLSKPLPVECVATKTQGGTTIQFLHWQTVARLLDTYAPGWHGAVVGLTSVGPACVLTYRLSIPAAEGLIVREATGQEDEEMKGYGDFSSNSEAMAFKRAAAKFGVGAYLYDKDQTAGALRTHLKAECIAALAELGKVVDAAGLEREVTIAWLKAQTGAVSNASIPLVAIRALTTQLGG